MKHFVAASPPEKISSSQLLEIYQKLLAAHGHQKWWPAETPFEVIIGAILVQNTSWANVEKAILKLKEANILSVKAMFKVPIKKLAGLIHSSGYYNQKAIKIKIFLEFLKINYSSSLPKMFQENGEILRKKLLSLKGIGPETADSILLYAGRKPFFVIDAYTKRIFSRHGLLPEASSYDEWRKLFEESLPLDSAIWNDFHAQIVLTAKNYCKKSTYDCMSCPLQTYH